MRIDRSKVLTFTLGTALLTGCGSYEPAAPSPPPKTEQPQAAGQEEKPAPPKDEGRPGKKERTKGGTPGGNRGQPKSKPNAGEAKQPQADAGGGKTEQRKAEFGVGAKGHDYGPGVITTPLSVYFTIQERMVFEIKLPKAMELFKATENRVPKSQEEFMQKIVKDNDIQLPALREGDRYVYDPKAGELMVATNRASAK